MIKIFLKLKNRVFVFVLLVTVLTFGQGMSKNQALTHVLFSTIAQLHIDPKNLDDTYSKNVFDTYLKRTDPSKRFFIQSDILTLNRYKFFIDDELRNGSRDFYLTTNRLFKMRLSQVKGWYPDLVKKNVLFLSSESLQVDPEKRNYCQNEKELKEYWRLLIKEQILNTYVLLVEALPTGSKELYLNPQKPIVHKESEKKAKEKVMKTFSQFFDRYEKETEENRNENYLNALLVVFDTHTSYFPPEQKKEFDISMSGKMEGIGAILQEDNGYIKVAQIVPGSPCFLQGDLKVDDIILKVGQSNAEPVDVIGAKVSDVVKLIRGKKGTQVKLTVKKTTGKLMVIPIVRDVVVIEETYAKSAVIFDEYSHKYFGYIYLPKFYRDFDDLLSRNTTDDIRKELQKLLQANVQGIVIDLRGNSGGALKDAIDMSGLFIDKGPIVQVKGRDGALHLHEDPNNGIAYAGPLVVLTNIYSASASEIFAAAMQDYRRAVIVGTSPSFGKGTVQMFVDLDQQFPQLSQAYQSLGSIKVTIQKFYRINGGSTQYKGVIPDIRLPDLLPFLEVGERYLDFSLPFDSIQPASFNGLKPNWDISTLQKNSQERVSQSSVFKAVQRYAEILKKDKENTFLTISLPAELERKNKIEKEAKLLENQQKVYDHLKVNPVDKKNKDPKTPDWITALSKDAYVEECISILNEMGHE